MAEMIYRTLKTIKNPVGDGRHDRANWQTPLKQSKIPAGFIFAISDDGTIRDLTVTDPDRTISGQMAVDLRKHIMAVAGPPLGGEVEAEEETVEDVIAAVGAEKAAQAIAKGLNLSPAELKTFLLASVSGPATGAGTTAKGPSKRPNQSQPQQPKTGPGGGGRGRGATTEEKAA
jgi:hypothetical protein